MQSTAADALAASLFRDHRMGVQHTPLRLEGQLLGSPLAYAVQERFVSQLRAAGIGEVGGYKIGLTSPAMQEMCGVHQPVVGQVFKSRIFTAPSRVRVGDFVRLGIESELAVRLAGPLPVTSDAVNPADLAGYIDAIAPMFELVEDRGADYNTLDAFSIIAENSWNKGIVLGEQALPAAYGDLTGLKGVLSINGVAVAEGSSSDVMAGPLTVLAWLGKFAAEVGYSFKPGDWIATGAIIPTKFAKAGDKFSFQLGDLPTVQLSLD